MEESYNVEDIISVEGREYCIVKKYNEYYIIVTIDTPLDIKVGKLIGNEFIPETNNEIIKEVLQSK